MNLRKDHYRDVENQFRFWFLIEIGAAPPRDRRFETALRSERVSAVDRARWLASSSENDLGEGYPAGVTRRHERSRTDFVGRVCDNPPGRRPVANDNLH